MADEGAWAHHLKALNEAGNDPAKFEAAHAALSSDRNVSNEHLGRIVRAYPGSGGIAMGRTRDAHMKQIRQAFIRNARFENKMR